MDADRLRPALVVLLAVVAVSAAAATIEGPDAASVGSGGEEGTGEGSGEGLGSGDGVVGGFDPVAAAGDTVSIPAWVFENLYLVVLGVGSLATLAYAGYRVWADGLEGLKRMLNLGGSTVAGGVLYAAVFAVFALVAWLSRSEGEPLQSSPSEVGGSGATDAGGADPTGTGIPPVLLFVGVVAVALLLVAFLLRTGDDGTDPSAADDSSDKESDRDRTGTDPLREPVAVDDVPPSNPVYRAWRQLATSVDRSSRETATPAEIARLAVEEGFDRDAVETVTETFEEVRYGRRPPTDERAERVRNALERLENGGEGV